MGEQIEVGQVWVEKQYRERKEILWVGETIIVFKRIDTLTEISMGIDNFKQLHYIEKPEPKLTKLVARYWNGSFNSIAIDEESSEKEWTKKEIIIKDNQIWIER